MDEMRNMSRIYTAERNRKRPSGKLGIIMKCTGTIWDSVWAGFD
jgi:hypothetical protein